MVIIEHIQLNSRNMISFLEQRSTTVFSKKNLIRDDFFCDTHEKTPTSPLNEMNNESRSLVSIQYIYHWHLSQLNWVKFVFDPLGIHHVVYCRCSSCFRNIVFFFFFKFTISMSRKIPAQNMYMAYNIQLRGTKNKINLNSQNVCHIFGSDNRSSTLTKSWKQVNYDRRNSNFELVVEAYIYVWKVLRKKRKNQSIIQFHRN